MNWLQQIADWIARLKCWYTVRPWEQAIRIRCGKWVTAISSGFHLRIPFLDEVFTQNVRMRVLNLPVQTVTTRDGVCVTLSGAVKWRISDVRLIYEKLHTPEDWIYNTVLAAVASAVYESQAAALTPSAVGEAAEISLGETAEMGLEIEGVSLTDFAIVRTYRLISGEGNTGWTWNRVGPLDQASHK